ncbi:MAG TPA: hypothetical protein VGG26_05165 [Terracidiphilus sp.]|jgi:hypothetical protein
METTCNRCHQAVEDGICYCPVCGLPQLVYSAENAAGQGQPEKWTEVVRDAGSIEWKPALRYALTLAIPAGVLCSLLSPLNILALLVMAGTAAWVVTLYMRNRRPSWLTLGAGARIGLVTGVLGSWTAAAASGIALYAARYWFHSGKIFDDFWDTLVNQQMSQQWASMGVDAQTIALTKSWMLSPEGRAGGVLCAVGFLVAALLVFAVAGAALSARFLARTRRPQV